MFFSVLLSYEGNDRDRDADWRSGSHNGVLVSHQPHCNTAHGTIPGLALPCYLPQLLHLERQSRSQKRRIKRPIKTNTILTDTKNVVGHFKLLFNNEEYCTFFLSLLISL